jgi:hypothetical protein
MKPEPNAERAMEEASAAPGYVLADLGGWISGPCSHIGHLELVPCGLTAGYLHLWDQRHPDDLIHVRADEFAAFALMIKGGVYDHLLT